MQWKTSVMETIKHWRDWGKQKKIYDYLPCSWIGRIIIAKITPLNETCICIEFLTKILMRFFRELKKYFLKCILKHKGPQVAKSFEQNKQFESLSDFKTLTTKPLQWKQHGFRIKPSTRQVEHCAHQKGMSLRNHKCWRKSLFNKYCWRN